MQSKTVSFDDLIAESNNMHSVVENAKKFAVLNAPLLIQGETGTGKDLLARACHNAGARRDKKFIAVNCAGLPSDDAESEMFGRVDKGYESIGFFEYANGGTVLLDSVAELPLLLQAKLLRFLNDGTFRRVGEEKEHFADVRVICTSQVPLQRYVEDGKMRGDLFHRLNVLSLTIPPLRERPEDIVAFTTLFIRQICESLAISIPRLEDNILPFLKSYVWKGNVRELHNALVRACTLAQNNRIRLADLALTRKDSIPLKIEEFGNKTLDEIMSNFEAMVLRKFYEQYPSTRKLAARLGVSHTAIANKLKNYGIGKS